MCVRVCVCVCVCESDRRVPRRASAAKKKKEDDDDDDEEEEEEEAEVGQETGVFLDGHNLTIKGYFSWL